MTVHPHTSTVRWTWSFFAILAALMLAATLAWQLPMMLWDHLDLVWVYRRWQNGDLDIATLFAPYNGAHVLAIPYLSMLATVTLAHGSTVLDGVASWLVMVTTGAIIIGVALRDIRIQPRRWPWLMLVLLAAYPGHLSNLQWGWQVQIFTCLLGAVAAIAQLAAVTTSATRMLAALGAGTIASLSFGASLVLIPIAVLMIALRTDLAWTRKAAWSLPWLILGGWVALPLLHGAVAPADAGPVTLFGLAHYTLNFIGSGIARHATDLAPWLALLAVASALDAWLKLPADQRGSAWLGFLLFGLGTAVITAIGRVGPFGVEQAFAQRYISFSTLFWVGWYGLLLTALPSTTPMRGRIYRMAMAIGSVLLVANALHLIRKAAITHERGVATADAVADEWPNVSEHVLRDIYFDQPEAARQRLEWLHHYRLAPFHRTPEAAAHPSPPAKR